MVKSVVVVGGGVVVGVVVVVGNVGVVSVGGRCTTNCLRQRRCWWNLLVGLASSSVGVKVARWQEEQAASMDRQVKSKAASMDRQVKSMSQKMKMDPS